MSCVKKALEELRKGRFVLVFDDEHREGETDLIIAAEHVTSESITTMRRDGGGLIILMVHHRVAQKFGIPFLTEVFDEASGKWPVLRSLVPNDIPYDNKSSFSLLINHRKTFTGITDNDRALTISEFARTAREAEKLTSAEAISLLGRRFRSPGHVPVCIASQNMLEDRKGHTELGVALSTMARLSGVVAGCEMMSKGIALPKGEAINYAERHGLMFLEGREIIKEWRAWSE